MSKPSHSVVWEVLKQYFQEVTTFFQNTNKCVVKNRFTLVTP
jgi:hypothetical protein